MKSSKNIQDLERLLVGKLVRSKDPRAPQGVHVITGVSQVKFKGKTTSMICISMYGTETMKNEEVFSNTPISQLRKHFDFI